MAYYDTIYLVAGDDKPELNFVLRDSNTAASGYTLDPNNQLSWAPLDLTGVTVRMKFRLLGGTDTLDTMTCVNVAPYTSGQCYMAWNATTLDVDAGTYEGELELTYSDGTVQTMFDKLKFKVRAQFS